MYLLLRTRKHSIRKQFFFWATRPGFVLLSSAKCAPLSLQISLLDLEFCEAAVGVSRCWPLNRIWTFMHGLRVRPWGSGMSRQ